MGAFLFDLEIGDAEAGVRFSPLTYVDQIRTPTLVLHGQEDLRCPLDQAEFWFTRLRDNGVPTQMVIYPGGSHTFFLDGPLSHRQDFNARNRGLGGALHELTAHSDGTAAINSLV